MALSPIEDRYLSALTEREFPTFTPDQAAMAAPEGVDSVQLAAGPSATVSDAGSGMPEMRATPRNPVMGGVADFVRGVRDLANQYEIKDFVPLLGGMGVGDLLVGKSPEELEEWAYGNAPMRIPEMSNVPIVKTGRKEQLMDTMFLGVDAAGLGKGAAMTAKAAAKNLGPKAAEMAGDMLKRQGLMPGVVPDGKTMPANPQAAVSDLGFFSAVEQAALNVQRKSGTGQAFLNDIAKGENVKADEIKWIGLDDFLKGKKNVTRDEVQQFIAQNKVEVKEVTLGDAPFGSAERQELTALSDIPRAQRTAEQSARINQLQDMANSEDAGASMTKFSQYTLPGGENYREILLTLPTPDSADDTRRLALMSIDRERPLTEAESAELRDLMAKKRSRPEQTTFTSSHWDEKNVLAHIRVNDRVDADGKKMLLIEEVQSDWHQAGRDKGYKSDPKQTVKAFEVSVDGRPVMAYETMEEAQAHVQRASQYNDPNSITVSEKMVEVNDPVNQANRVPDAPMKDTWYQLALKRALKYAADNGYERVGLTTGARQAERYDLSKQVDGIFYTKNDDGTFNVSVAKGDSEVWADTAAKPERLSEVVGKDIAKKIVDGEGSSEDGAKALRGLDLQVGGEGMKKYYDEVYPKFLEKYGKKWGAKVGETSVNIGTEDKMVSKLRERGYDPETVTLQEILSDNNGRTPGWLTEDDVLMLELGVELTSKGVQKEPIRFVDITPEMRQSVSKGQPLFTAAPIGAGTAATMQDKEN